MQSVNSEQFGIAIIKQLVVTSVLLLVQVYVFYISAGNLTELGQWFYFAAAFIYYVFSTALQFKLCWEKYYQCRLLLISCISKKFFGTNFFDPVLIEQKNLTKQRVGLNHYGTVKWEESKGGIEFPVKNHRV